MTTRSSPSYLFRTPYSYYFRIRIPDDLRLHFAGRTKIKRSLQTGYLSDAKYKARLIAGQVQRLFRYLHGKEANAMTAKKYSKFTDDLLDDIVPKYVQGHMDGFEAHMLEERNRHLTMEELETWNGDTRSCKMRASMPLQPFGLDGRRCSDPRSNTVF